MITLKIAKGSTYSIARQLELMLSAPINIKNIFNLKLKARLSSVASYKVVATSHAI